MRTNIDKGAKLSSPANVCPCSLLTIDVALQRRFVSSRMNPNRFVSWIDQSVPAIRKSRLRLLLTALRRLRMCGGQRRLSSSLPVPAVCSTLSTLGLYESEPYAPYCESAVRCIQTAVRHGHGWR